jgi:protein-disulfide isomerase
VIVERVNRFLGWRAVERVALRQAPLARRAKPKPPPAIDAGPARRCHIPLDKVPIRPNIRSSKRGSPLRTTRRQFLLAASSLALAAGLAGTGGLELFSHGALAQSVAEAELMQPGPLGDEVLGDDKAPVTIIEYASMTCPHCAHFALTTFPQLKEKYIDTGKVKYILREFPFDPIAAGAFMLARCAGGKDKYYAMVDLLFRTQATWAVEKPLAPMLATVKQAGFTQDTFSACLANQKLLEGIEAVRDRAAKQFKVASTPTFFINGQMTVGALSFEDMQKLIDPLIKS